MPEPPFDPPTAHRWFGVELNNTTSDALSAGQVTRETCDAHIHAAHASCHHWMQVGTVANRARGELTVANVYAAAGMGEEALRHARLCLDLAEANLAEMADFDFAFAYDVLARAHAAAGHLDQARDAREQARAAGAAIADEGDRAFFFEWFEGGNWHARVDRGVRYAGGHGRLRATAPHSTGTWTQANPSTCSKWPSDDTRSVPVSMAWAAIPHVVGGQGTPFRPEGCSDPCVAIRRDPADGYEGDVGIRQECVQLADVPSRTRTMPIPVQQLSHHDGGEHDFLRSAHDVGDRGMAAGQLRIGGRVQEDPHDHMDRSMPSKSWRARSISSACSRVQLPMK